VPLRLLEPVKTIIADLESFIHGYMREEGIPGVVIALIRGGEIVWTEGFGDVVEFIYLLIYLFTIFDTADVETPVLLAISAMGKPYSEKSLIAIRNQTDLLE
jgi:hypothetical protein